MPLIVLLLAVSALLFIWNTDQSRQHHILQSIVLALITLLLLFAWAVLFSGLQTRARRVVLAAFILLCVAIGSSFKVTGVTGDLLPIIKPRWHKPPQLTSTVKTNAASAAPNVSFPQFLGATRDGTLDTRLETNWTANPPQLLWRRPVGNAWSGFAIANGLAITQEQRDQSEFVAAYDLLTGEPRWLHSDPARHSTPLGGEGPRATPTIHSNRVYTLGALGDLNCLDLPTGKRIWTKNLTAKLDGDVPEWGFANSPLILSNLLVVQANSSIASLAAFNIDTGDVAWTGGHDNNGYSSPALVTLAGAPQIISFNAHNVSAHDPANGRVLWEHPWPATHPHVTTPIAISTNTLLVSSGYGYGSELLEISRNGTNFTAARVWKSNRFKSKFANMIPHAGHVYGLDDGILAAIDPADGRRIWHDGRVGHGQLLLAKDTFLLMAENGEVQLIAPNPTEPEQDRTIARLKVFKDKTWNPPALAGEYLLIRNNIEAACYKLRVRN